MTVTACIPQGTRVPLLGRWVIEAQVTDDDGVAVDVEPTITVTLPDGTPSSVTPEARGDGVYRGVYVPEVSTGRYVARVAADGYGVADFVAYVWDVAPGTAMPTLADVLDYLGWAEDTVTNDAATALATESAAQRAICDIDAEYPDDLRGALYRRVARILAMKKLSLAVPRGDAQTGPPILPGNDPEVRRLERPYRRLTVF